MLGVGTHKGGDKFHSRTRASVCELVQKCAKKCVGNHIHFTSEVLSGILYGYSEGLFLARIPDGNQSKKSGLRFFKVEPLVVSVPFLFVWTAHLRAGKDF